MLFEELRKSFQQSATLEEQMLALYLMNELSTPEKVGFFFDVTQAKNGVPIVSQLESISFTE